MPKITTPAHERQTMQIAAADEVAAQYPAARQSSNGKWKMPCIAHDGDDPNLVFYDGKIPGESALRVHCYSHECDPDLIRHIMQSDTGLRLCRCDDCYSAWRQDQSPPVTTAREKPKPKRTNKPKAEPKITETPSGWGGHKLQWDNGSGCHSVRLPCPECGAARGMVVWSLAPHEYPYCGFATVAPCECDLSYHDLHRHFAQIVQKKKRQKWRQDSYYRMTNGVARLKWRTDPGKDIFWDTEIKLEYPDIDTIGRDPCFWNYRRGIPHNGRRVLVTEGEKAAAACVSAGLDGQYSVVSMGGADGFGNCATWPFRDKSVLIWPDSDNSNIGVESARKLVARIADIAADISIINTEELPNKTDAADFSRRRVRDLINNHKMRVTP